MREYVVLHSLKHHRNINKVIEARNNKEWRQIIEPPANRRTIGIMGLGNLGLDCAIALKNLGFIVNGWSKSRKNINGIKTFSGIEELNNFIEEVDRFKSVKIISNKKAEFILEDGSKKIIDF